MSLSVKFNLVLIGVLLGGLIATGVSAWEILRRNAEREVLDTAGLMMEAALAVRGYTVSEIRPLLAPHMTDVFYPQTVPAYAATQAFEKLRESHVEFAYKEATLNPTNPRDRATDWEADIVHAFRNGQRSELVGVRATPTGDSLYLARPIQIKDEECLYCHSTVEAAPAAMLAQYGGSNGFGWQLDEIVGAQVVSVPMHVPLAAARDAFTTFMTAIAAVFLVTVVALNLLLRHIVIRPITEMARVADAVSMGNLEVPQFEARGKDEMATLAASFNRMRRSLEKAMSMLGAR